ncbi:cytokinin dehydrogenase 5-like [Prosopis cineraria]|uniref:cytokinin dehydrogenase 5-like n=1 Tax=Prosopis cineraria TaxID=364024 RepID=UPI00240F063B|nr:cytokinin dehydrogenase 5-like [Prosopis cineraria]
MKNQMGSAAKLVLALSICGLTVTVGLTAMPVELGCLGIKGDVTVDEWEVKRASVDFGMMKRAEPLAVLHPASAEDVATVVREAYELGKGLRVSARGEGHSTNGQAQAGKGVVIDMRSKSSVRVWEKEKYVDVWGGELWIKVLMETLEYGLAPKSWTDYLYLTVGGTLSNAGISGQTFHQGPQIANVHQLDVVTGKGELLTCSEDVNTELFHAVLGGLGQFGIITRARIALEPAPHWVRWIRVLYSDFSVFTKDQEFLISLHGKPASERFDYVEGFVIVDEGLINNWRSSFFSPSNPVTLSSLNADGGVLYCLEITKGYDEGNAHTVDQEIDGLLEKLDFIETSVFTTDVTYVDFLDRVHKAELKLRSKGLWEVPHPWLNLFVPKSRIADFDKGVFRGILGNTTSGPILIYPMNSHKWDQRSSVVTPEEEVFYLVAFLRSAVGSETVEYLNKENREILRFCDDKGINVKQYLPHYTKRHEWKDHFGDKWDQFYQRKMQFDPGFILATGQRIFEPSTSISNFVQKS